VSNLLWAAYSIGLGRLGGVAFAGSPILAAAFGIALGFLLAGPHTAGKRLRPLLVAAVASSQIDRPSARTCRIRRAARWGSSPSRP
jgi:hypothetical protein